MNIFTRAQMWLARGLYKAATGQSLSFLPEWVRHAFFVPTWQAIVKNGIKGNSAVWACLTALAFGFSEPPLRHWTESEDGLQPVANSPVRKLLRRPNPDQGEAEFKQYCVIYAAAAGNLYLWKQRGRNGLPVALWPFSDGVMTPIPGRDTAEGMVVYYVLDIGDGKQSNPFGVNRFDDLGGVAIPKTDIIHWKWMPDPEQPWIGRGAVAGAAGDISTDTEIREYVYSLLKNDASPPLVVTLVEGEEVSDVKVARLGAQWMQKYGGAKRGVPAFLEAGMTVTQTGMNLQQLAYEALHNIPESRIAAAFRVPPIIAGLNIGLQRSTFSNYAEAREAFTEDTLIPLWHGLESEIEQSLMTDFGEELVLRHDLSEVRSLQEDQTALWLRVQSAWESSLLTRAAALRMLGVKSTPEDEVYKVGVATMFLPEGEMMPASQPAQIQDAPAPPKMLIDGRVTYSTLETKVSRESLKNIIAEKRRIRALVSGRAEGAIDTWFEKLAGKVVDAAASIDPKVKGVTPGQWELLMEQLFQQEALGLENVLKRYTLEVITLTWPLLNLELQSDARFSENDPLVQRTLEAAGLSIRDITETTRIALADFLKVAYEDGQPIEEIADGIRGLITETYANRGRAIARTEIGKGQNSATADRFAAAGVQNVLVFDNGFDNSHEFCRRVDGKVVSLAWSRRNSLQHPNCVRAFGAVFDYRGEVFEEEVPWP